MKDRNIRFTPNMKAEERYLQKRLGFIKVSLNEVHGIPFERIYINKELKRVSIEEEVIKTNTNGSLRFFKYNDIEQKLESHMDEWLSKNSSQRL